MYTKKQAEFIQLALEGKNVFLTGKAGTGKSFIVKELIKVLKENKKRVMAIAPTGIAANNIEGQTIHSTFYLPPFGVLDYESCNHVKENKRMLLRNVDTIVIDEVSMLRPDTLDAMHYTLRKNMVNGLDKKQVIFVGDMAQLPPVLDDNTRSVLLRTYNGDTFEYAMIFQKMNVLTIDLDEVMRQSDQDFILGLNIIREGKKSEYFRQFVSSQAAGIILAPHNATVAKYNQLGLDSQKGELFTFKADIQGELKPEDFNLEKEIKVKNGCKIMYLVNSKDNPLRNGTIGIFVSHAGCNYIRVGNVDYALEPFSTTKKEYVYDKAKDDIVMKELGSITQLPIRLAYALSIHKSQGLTFDEVTVDLTRPCFQKGQMYVALSRVKTPQGLKILI